MEEIKVTEKLLQRLFKVYDAMWLLEEIEPWDSDMAAHVFFKVLKEMSDDRRTSKKKI